MIIIIVISDRTKNGLLSLSHDTIPKLMMVTISLHVYRKHLVRLKSLFNFVEKRRKI